MASLIPNDRRLEQAAVLPLTLSTAAAGLFQSDRFGLSLSAINPPTATRACSSGAGLPTSVAARPSLPELPGTVSSPPPPRITSTTSACPAPRPRSARSSVQLPAERWRVRSRSAVARCRRACQLHRAPRPPTRGLRAAAAHYPHPCCYGSLQGPRRLGRLGRDTEVQRGGGPGIDAALPPAALPAGTDRAVPEAVVLGEGLGQIPNASERFRQGVFVKKLVVRL
jgi:hypothetical protein